MKKLLTVLLIAAAIGVSAFGVVVSRVVKTESVPPDQAALRFAAAREEAIPTSALSSTGSPRIHPTEERSAPTMIEVLAYDVSKGWMSEAEIPLWFYRLKGGALQFALDGTSLDLEENGVRPKDLQERAPGIVLDETRADGGRLLVWLR